MPSIRTLRDLPHDARDEPLHSPRDLRGSLTPEVEQIWCEFFATSEHLATQPHTSAPVLPDRRSGFHESVLEGDQEIPAERVFIIDAWKHGTCMSASGESPGCRHSKCEEAEGFNISSHEGDRDLFKARGPIDDQEKHGTCMSASSESSGCQDSRCEEAAVFNVSTHEGAQDMIKERGPINDHEKNGTCMSVTIGIPEPQDSGCERATSFNASSVEVDVRCIRGPSRAEASGMGSAGVLRSAWMWMLQKKDVPRIDDSGKYGFPICMSAVSVIAGTAIASALQYVALPHVNPLQYQDRSGWWYCPLSCTLIWMPINIAYIGILLDQFVLAETGVQLTYLELFLLWLVGSITLNSLFAALSWVSPLYPFPLVGLIVAPFVFIGVVIVFGLCIYPRLRQAFPKHEARKIVVKTLPVFAIFVWSICLLDILLLLLALINRIGSESLTVLVVLLAGSLREACTAATAKLAEVINPEAAIIGQNLSMACFGVGFTMIVGNSSSILPIGAIILMDIIRGVIVGIMTGNVFIGQFNLSVFLLQLHPALLLKLCTRRNSKLTESALDQQKSTLKSSLIASETGEVILPIAYLCSWLVVRVGPYSASFSGIGTRDYGLDPPEMISRSVIVTVVLIVLEALSAILLKLSLRYFVRVSICYNESYNHFGKLLTVQNIWVVHTCICSMMISCGFDASLRWAPQD